MKSEVIMPETKRRQFTDEFKSEAVRLAGIGPAGGPGGSGTRDF